MDPKPSVRGLFWTLEETHKIAAVVEKEMAGKPPRIPVPQSAAFIAAATKIPMVLTEIYAGFASLPVADRNSIGAFISEPRKKWDEAAAGKLVAALKEIRPSLEALAGYDPTGLVYEGYGTGKISLLANKHNVAGVVNTETVGSSPRDPGAYRTEPFKDYTPMIPAISVVGAAPGLAQKPAIAR